MRKTSSSSFFAADWLQRFQAPLAAHGDMARAGQMVAPADWPGKKRRQNAVAARWTKMQQATHDGDKHLVTLMSESLLLSLENLSRSLRVGAAESPVIEPHKNQTPIIPVVLHSPSMTRLRNGDIEPRTAADRCTA